jgi:circadian clock protein KaiC
MQASAPFTLGIDLERAVQPGPGLQLLEMPAVQLDPDVFADRVLAMVDASGARRPVVDSVADLERAVLRSADPQRLEDYLVVLLHALRSRDAMVLFVLETERAGIAVLDRSGDVLAVLAENVLLLRRVPYGGHLQRVASVLQLRYTDHDTSLRVCHFVAPQGFEALSHEASVEATLGGITGHLEARAPAEHHEGGRRGRGRTR